MLLKTDTSDSMIAKQAPISGRASARASLPGQSHRSHRSEEKKLSGDEAAAEPESLLDEETAQKLDE